MISSRFIPIQPRIWEGKYSRVPGDHTTLSVTRVDGRWRPNAMRSIGDETAQCNMADSSSGASLAQAVINGKRFLGGKRGGSFLINEFGQVLVPAQVSVSADVAIVGSLRGSLMLHDPFTSNRLFDFSDTSNLQQGSVWDRPYFGIRYNLSKHSKIYFWQQSQTRSWKNEPPVQDGALIDSIRRLRPRGAVRFLVTYDGIVLTKVPVGDPRDDDWEPRYVTRINKRSWYPKEA